MTPSSRWHALDALRDVLSLTTHGDALFAARDDGQVLRSLDEGQTWHPLLPAPVGTPVTLLVADDRIWTGTTGGVVRAARAEGWQPQHAAPRHVIVTALARQESVMLAGTLRAGLYRSTDGGVTWEPTRTGLPLGGERLRVFDVATVTRGFVVAHALGMSISRDEGLSWQPAASGLPLRIPYAALATDGPMLYAGVSGHLYCAATSAGDATLTWTEIHEGSERPLGLLAAADGALFAAVGSEPFLIASADDAASWQNIADGLPEPPVALAVTDAFLVALLGDGRLWRAPLVPVEHRTTCLLDLDVRQQSAETTFAFSLQSASAASLTIHDVLGNEITCLATGWFGAGDHQVQLPAGVLPPGFYQCRLRAGTTSRTAPLIVMD